MNDAAPDPKCPGCQALLKRIERLEAEIDRLKSRLGQDSSNSNRPPSSDPPWKKSSEKGPPSERQRGGQPGHEKSSRPLLPPDEVDEIHCVKPKVCSECGTQISGEDPAPRRYQVTEIPPIRPVVTEYQVHALRCRSCSGMTTGELPAGVPRGAFGSRLQSLVVLLSGVFRMSRRNVQALMADGFGVELSLGSISKIERGFSESLAEPHERALEAFQRQRVAHADETGWREAGSRAWLWAGVSAAVSVFLIRRTRGSSVAKELLGANSRATCVSDRWSGYSWIDPEQRQLCWAHLTRDFRRIADAGGETRVIGERLLQAEEDLFHHWHAVSAGELSRRGFRRRAAKIRRKIRSLLEIGTASRVCGVASLCRGILELEPAMWTFVERPGVEPTNNPAERAIRPAVIWRKTSMGTQSGTGSRFAERILTCVTNLRRQKRNVLDYLTAVCDAALKRVRAPPLIA